MGGTAEAQRDDTDQGQHASESLAATLVAQSGRSVVVHCYWQGYLPS